MTARFFQCWEITVQGRALSSECWQSTIFKCLFFIVCFFNKVFSLQLQADLLPPDQVVAVQPWRPNFLPSYKPQKNELGSECTVRLLLERKRPIAKMHSRFVSDVMKPLQIYPLLDRKVATLSPGETQRVAITLCLATVSIGFLQF